MFDVVEIWMDSSLTILFRFDGNVVGLSVDLQVGDFKCVGVC